MKKIIIIEGYLASGKSTFATMLSESIKVPCLIKDTFKIAMCSHIEVANRAEKSRFSVITFDAMMYVVDKMLAVGQPIMIEGNFVPAGVKKIDEASIIKGLIDKYNYDVLTYKFMGDTNVLYERFISRENEADRGTVNTIGATVAFEDFNKWCHNLDNFNVGGQIIKVDTTDFAEVDFNALVEAAKHFLERD